MKYFLLLTVLLFVGCEQPPKPPMFRQNDLVLDACQLDQEGQCVAKATTIVSSPGIIVKVDHGHMYWQYLVMFEGYSAWLPETSLRRMGRLDWSTLFKLNDDTKTQPKIIKP